MLLTITSLGMISSVGFGVVPACASIRAGIARPRPLHSFQVLSSEPAEALPLTAHPVEGYTEGFAWVGRWLRLATGALGDLLRYGELPEETDSRFWDRTGLVAALPFPDEESLSGRYDQDLSLLKRAYLPTLLRVARLPIQAEHTHVIWSGHVGSIDAVCHAHRMLQSAGVDRVVIVAADSYLDETTLNELLSQRRLKTPDVPCGMAPGEAAACFLVESQRSARTRKPAVEALIRAAVTARDEQFSFRSPHTGAVLAQVMEQALDMADVTTPFVGDIHTDLNGENWRASQLAHARVRLSHRFSDRIRIGATALSLGDVGAASGAVSVCVTCRSYRRGYALSDTSLVVSLSESGHCGALVLERFRS
jgi:3-oxoacyl-[acyl-carrier-protein] synthase-1